MAAKDRRERDRPKDDGQTGIPYARTGDPVKIDGPSPSENSRLRAATAIQSSVEPQDYPDEQRDEQVAAATGKPAGSRDKPPK